MKRRTSISRSVSRPLSSRRRGAACRQEAAQLRAKLGPGRFVLEQDVVGAVKRDELGTRNQRREVAPFVERDYRVVPGVQHQRRNRNRSRQIADVHGVPDRTGAGRVLTRTRCSLQFVEPRRLRIRATRYEQRGEHSPKRRVRLAPAQPGQRDEHLGFLPGLRCRIACDPALCVGAVEHQCSHSIRMTNRIGDRHRTAPAGAEQAESVHAGGIDDSLEVVDPVLQRQARILPVGQAAAALVVPDEGVLLAQEFHPVAPDRRRPVPFEVGHPMSGLDHRRAVPAGGVGEPHAIRRGAEPQFLAHVNMLRASRHARRRNLGSSTDAVRSVKFLSLRAWRWCAR